MMCETYVFYSVAEIAKRYVGMRELFFVSLPSTARKFILY